MTTTRRVQTALAGVALLSTLGLSACGSDEPPKAKDLWSKAQDSLAKRTSFTIKGTSKDARNRALSLVLSGDTAGKAYTAQIHQGSGVATLITTGGKSYVKANSDYYKNALNSTAASVSSFIADKWVINGTSETSSPIKKVSEDVRNDSDSFAKQMLSDKATVSEDKIDGKDVWKITGADKKSTAWVTKDDKYDLLKAQGLDNQGKKNSQTISTATMSDYDKVPAIKAPAGAKTPQELVGSSIGKH